jgi:Arc/MetJ-type ribon-helix-helix transcriptional regulator
MSTDPVPREEKDEQLQEMIRLVHALDTHAPAELAKLLSSHGLGDDARRAVEAVAEAHSPDVVVGNIVAQFKQGGAARKVSVSMPEDLTAAVQRRVGRGKFSQYVTEAVSRQLELDLLAELSELLASEHGPVPEEHLAEARAAWPDDE